MGTINAVRLININYNNNAIRINDETLHFNGESTLISLHNGGGKSVLVQMMMAPFVHARYRGMKDRPFEGYFTSARPSFILVEWLLDGGAGKVMTGIMVRQNQEDEEENASPLELVGLISEYDKPCLQDIHHLPVVEKTKKEMTLRNFTDCRHIFEEYKKNPEMKFFCYDLNRNAQQAQYFSKLKEYKIDYREWEDIIKKVNLKESGLSDLFADCKDEKGLVEKWLLESVEKKLDPDREKIKNFQNIIEKHTIQYKENESKIKRRDAIALFKKLVLDNGEAKGIKALAEAYEEKIEEKAGKEGDLADLREKISELLDDAERKLVENQEEIEKNEKETAHIVYEKYSYEVYLLEQEFGQKGRERELLLIELEQKRGGLEKTDRRLHILECARQNDTCMLERKMLQEKQAKYEVLIKKHEDLKPRLDELGGMLHAIYETKNAEICQVQEEVRKKIQNSENKAEEKRRLATETDRELNQCERALGGLDNSIQAFSDREEEFNKMFGQQFSRNILGEYEAGSLEIAMEQNDRELEAALREGKDLSRKLSEYRRLSEKLSGDREDAIIRRTETNKSLENKTNLQRELEAEKEGLETIAKFLQLDSDAIFDRALMNRTIEKKIGELEALKVEQNQYLAKCRKELEAFAEGKILELPAEMIKGLESLGIEIVYGMEWLKKNQHTYEENREKVKKCPFLPYSLILTEREMDKLRQYDGELYSSLPVPLILRQDLEKEQPEAEGKLVDFEGLHFYVSFNERLLNEEELKKLLDEKEKEIHGIEGRIAIRDSEIGEYYEKKGSVNASKFTKELYEEVNNAVENLREELGKAERMINGLNGNISENAENLQECERLLKENAKMTEKRNRYKEGLENFARAYEAYLSCGRQREQLRKNMENLQIRKKLAQQGAKELEEEIRMLTLRSYALDNERKETQRKASEYEAYRKKEGADYGRDGAGKGQIFVSPEEMEAEFRAISSRFSGEITEVEKDIAMLSERKKKAENDLRKLEKKYSLTEEDWIGERYDENEEDSLSGKRKRQSAEVEQARGELDKCSMEYAALDQKRKDARLRMMEETGCGEPLPLSQIGEKDFESRKNLLKHRQKELQKDRNERNEAKNGYRSILNGLEEFKEFQGKGEGSFQEDLSNLSISELTKKQGDMKSEYRKVHEEIQRCRNVLSDRLNEVVKMAEFADEYYKKPLEAMCRLLDAPKDILNQIDITVQAYDFLMEKIAVDISMVERERDEIVNELLDYVEDVDEALNRIDANSTISVRERPVKMLEILVPDRLENRELYRLRMRDFMEELTKNVAEILKKNETPQDYIALRVNTRNLYDTVVGICNVQVKIYKIEKQRAYQISWADAAKNSGGEGFLSTFVILSSLLYFIRRDENDLFAEKNEGKVLLMDNPFAQTNAEHLLKPLMEVAKKNNTQLICLTGLGGDSIYGRFDNIYVLNLVAARLNGGMQYLKTDHFRGAEPETISASQVEVYDQITLF